MPKKNYTCPHCLSKSYKKRYLRGGNSSRNGRFSLECLICGKSFTKEDGLDCRHEET